MLINSLKILDPSEKEFLELIFFQSDQKVSRKYYRTDLSSVSDPLRCWLSISVLIGGFSGI